MARLNRRVTMADVAEFAGVTKTTVSRVLNNKGEISDETRDRVLKAVDNLGYRPSPIARSLATNETLRIGILVPVLSNPYFGAILEGIESVLWENDYHILLCNTGGNADREEAVMHLFEDHRVDGVIILSAHTPAEQLSCYIRNQPAVVTLNTRVEPGVAGCIYTNEIETMQTAVNHLAKSHHRHLGFIGFSNQTYASQERRRGFELAVKKAGLEFDSNAQALAMPNGDPTATLIEQFLRANPKLDGLVCFNDGIAARALQLCMQLGRRVPDDVAIIGYDDTTLAEFIIPSLTTLDLTSPKQEVGAMTGRMLLERIENNKTQQEDVMLHHRLIIRDSAP